MVTVSNYVIKKNDKGEDFVLLILSGDLEMVQSKEGNYYATAKKASLASTFTEEVAKTMIGKQISGQIVKKECEVYDYLIPGSNKIVELAHRWVFIPDNKQDESTVISNAVKSDLKQFSTNGRLVEA